MEEAIKKAEIIKPEANIYISGGAGLYKEAIDLVDKMYITEIDKEIEGDTSFPLFDESIYIKEIKEHFEGEIPYTYITYTKLKAIKNEFGFSPALFRAFKLQTECIGGNTMNMVLYA